MPSYNFEQNTQRDLECLRRVDDYTLRHLAVHLHEAGQYDKMYRLLVGNRAWMEAKSERLAGDAAYAKDLKLAIDDFQDPLKLSKAQILAQLHVALRVLSERVRRLSDYDLTNLVMRGRMAEALNQARLRTTPESIVDGLMAIYRMLEVDNHCSVNLFDEVRETAWMIQDDVERMKAMCDLAIAAKPFEPKQRISVVLDEAYETAEAIQDGPKRVEALCELASVTEQVGLEEKAGRTWEAAVEVAWGIQDFMRWPEAFHTIVKALVKNGHLGEATETVLVLQDRGLWAKRTLVETLAGMAVALRRVGLEEDTKQVLNDLSRLVQVIQDEWICMERQRDLTGERARVGRAEGDEDEVYFIHEENYKEAMTLRYEAMDALLRLVAALAMAGYFDEAAQMADSIEDGMTRERALKSLAKALACAGRFQRALEVVHSIQNIRQQLDALCEIAVVLERESQADQVKAIAEEMDKVERAIQHNRMLRDLLQTIGEAQRTLVRTLIQARCYGEAKELACSIRNDYVKLGALCELAAALTVAGLAGEADAVFKRAKKRALAIQWNWRRSDTLKGLVRTLSQAGRYRDAEDVAHSIRDEGIRLSVLCDLAITSIATGRVESAGAVFEQVTKTAQGIQEDHWHTQQALCELAASLAQAGFGDRARLIFDQVIQTVRCIEPASTVWYTSEMWLILALALLRAGFLHEAGETVRAIKHEGMQSTALKELGMALVQVGCYDKAAEQFSLIQRDSVRAEARCELVFALGQAGHYNEAESVAHSIRDSRQKVFAYCKLAAVLMQVGLASQATTVFERARQVGQAIQDEQTRAQALRDLTETLMATGRFDEAASSANSITSEMVRLECLRDLTLALTKAGRFEDATKTVRAIRYHGTNNTRARASLAEAQRDLAQGLAQSGRFDEANAWIQAIQPGLAQDEALLALAQALTEARELSKAMNIARSIQDKCLRAEAQCDLATALTYAGLMDEAGMLFEEARRGLRDLSDNQSRSEALCDLTQALAQSGRFDEANETTQAIQEGWIRDKALIALVEALTKAKHFEEAEKIACSIQGSIGQVAALCELAVTMSQLEHISQAKTVFEGIAKKTYAIQDDYKRANALSSLAKALAQAGQPEDAKDALMDAVHSAYDIKNSYYRGRTLRDLAVTLAEAGYLEEYNSLLKQITDTSFTDESYWIRKLIDLAEALAEAGARQKAEGVLICAGERARKIQDAHTRLDTLRNLAMSLIRIGMGEEGELVFEDAVRAAYAVQNDRARLNALHVLARSATQTGLRNKTGVLLDDAVRVARALQDDQVRSNALYSLAVSLMQVEMKEEARAVFEDAGEAARAIQHDYTRWKIFWDLAISMTCAGFCEEAYGILEDATKARLAMSGGVGQVDDISSAQVSDLSEVEPELNALAQAMQHEEVKKTIRFLQFGDSPSQLPQMLLVASRTLMQAGCFKEAEEVARFIRDPQMQVDAMADLAEALAQTGHYKEVEEFSCSIPYMLRVRALCSLAAALKGTGRLIDAETILRRVYEEVREMESIGLPHGRWHRFQLKCNLAASLARAGFSVQAKPIFKEAAALACSIKLDGNRNTAQELAGMSLIEAGLFQEANEIAHAIAFEARQARVLSELARRLAHAERFEEAKEVARSIRQNNEQTASLHDLAVVLAQAGRLSDALNTAQGGLDTFLGVLLEWVGSSTRHDLCSAETVLEQATRIAGWVSPGWHEVYEVLCDTKPPETATLEE